MHSIMDLCFLCTKDYNCVPVDNRIVSQVEYILPEITIFKLGIPLRICSVCDGALYAFSKFKQFYVESSQRLEASIKGVRAPPLQTLNPQIINNEICSTQPQMIKEQQISVKTNTTPTDIQLHKKGPPENVQLHTNGPPENVQLYTNGPLVSSQLHNVGPPEIVQPNSYTFATDSNRSFLEPIIELQSDEMVPQTQHEEEIFPNMNQNTNIKENLKETQNQCTTETIDGSSVAMDTEIYKSEMLEEIYIKEEKLDEPDSYENCDTNKREQETNEVNESITGGEMWEENSGVTDFTCNICNKPFKYKVHLDNHMKIHSDMQDLICSICNKLFTNKEIMLQHLRMHSELPDLTCPKCYQLFPNRIIMLQHMKTHSNPKNFICPLCNKAFASTSQLKQHEKIHSDNKEFQCDICHKSYTQKYNFDYHMKTHSGIKDFPCIMCNKAFACSSTLKRHMKMHSGIKDYSCEICGKSFAQKHHLDNHVRTHSKVNHFL